jgi:hypothetical protein
LSTLWWRVAVEVVLEPAAVAVQVDFVLALD